MNRRWIRSVLLLATVLAGAMGLALWKYLSTREAIAAFANQPEPSESVVAAVAKKKVRTEPMNRRAK
jgi:membrane fusion protein, multidrug efflux system